MGILAAGFPISYEVGLIMKKKQSNWNSWPSDKKIPHIGSVMGADLSHVKFEMRVFDVQSGKHSF
jgi:hypothetical protein